MRPEEPIHEYGARMQTPRRIWQKLIPELLSTYVGQQRIDRVFVACSSAYQRVLPAIWPSSVSEVHSHCPSNRRGTVAILREMGESVVDLISSGMTPNERWLKVR